MCCGKSCGYSAAQTYLDLFNGSNANTIIHIPVWTVKQSIKLFLVVLANYIVDRQP